MKLWDKNGNTKISDRVEAFTIGNDKEFDVLLAPHDVIGSIAHVKMLATVGLLTKDEETALVNELRNIYNEIKSATSFKMREDVEDIHSQVELMLTEKLGDTGKKIHSARSRNDQVLLDIRLFLREQIEELTISVSSLFELLLQKSNQYKDFLLPGYTHLQLAMPSSFGLWFGAYAESLVDDVIILQSAYGVVNKNPLGSAAGYGSSFPINRTLTTKLLGFDELNYNVVYAQMGRGKVERITAMGLANIADTLSRLSMDACLYMGQDLNFIFFNPELTTGSSIMPHKKNPDVFELIRSHCNRIKALPNEIFMMTTNLPSGYHRDLQLLKEHLFPAFENLKHCIEMMQLMLQDVTVRKDILEDEKYKNLFSVEEVSKLVLQGVPFRDAYKKTGMDIEDGKFTPSKKLNHTHEGSIGNLCNDKIAEMMQQVKNKFPFDNVRHALETLIAG